MLRSTLLCRVRLPKTRRPRERAWEIFNTRDFGFNEGSQNVSMWGLCFAVTLALLGFELFQQWKRILARGDSCPACEAARKHYHQRVENKEFEMREAARRGRAD